METPFKFKNNALVRYVPNGQICIVVDRDKEEGTNCYNLEVLTKYFTFWDEERETWDIRRVFPTLFFWAIEEALEAFTPIDWAEHAKQEDVIRALQAKLDELMAKPLSKDAYIIQKCHKEYIEAINKVDYHRLKLLKKIFNESKDKETRLIAEVKQDMKKAILEAARIREYMRRLKNWLAKTRPARADKI